MSTPQKQVEQKVEYESRVVGASDWGPADLAVVGCLSTLCNILQIYDGSVELSARRPVPWRYQLRKRAVPAEPVYQSNFALGLKCWVSVNELSDPWRYAVTLLTHDGETNVATYTHGDGTPTYTRPAPDGSLGRRACATAGAPSGVGTVPR